MKKSLLFCFLCVSAAALTLPGCKTAQEEPPVLGSVASLAKFPVKLDGELKDAAWTQTPGFELMPVPVSHHPREAAVIDKDHFETSVFKMLYDDEYLYVGCALEDTDVTNDYKENQTMLIRGGDVFEFFISPMDAKPTCCWEFYAAPNGLRSSYFYPSRGMVGVISAWNENPENLMEGFAVKVHVNGTLNDHKDTDRSWTVEMRIPLKELEAKCGVRFAPGTRWRVQAARYNYGMHFNAVQNSVYPKLPSFGYHFIEYYSPVEIRK